MFDVGKLRSVESLNAAGWSLREAEVGRVIECSWVIVAGSWSRMSRRMQLDDCSWKLRLVELLNAAGWSLREAEVGQVVECSWMIIADSWGWSSCWIPVLTVQLLNPGFDSTVVESRFWQYVALSGGVLIWLLAHTASRMWARCCNARAVHNSESLRGLDAALLECCGW